MITVPATQGVEVDTLPFARSLADQDVAELVPEVAISKDPAHRLRSTGSEARTRRQQVTVVTLQDPDMILRLAVQEPVLQNDRGGVDDAENHEVHQHDEDEQSSSQ